MASVDVLDVPRVIKILSARRRIGSALVLPASIYRPSTHRYDFENILDLELDW